jgi:hypothetical protein
MRREFTQDIIFPLVMDVLDWCSPPPPPPQKKTPHFGRPLEPVLEQAYGWPPHLHHKIGKKNYWAGHELLGHTY